MSVDSSGDCKAQDQDASNSMLGEGFLTNKDKECLPAVSSISEEPMQHAGASIQTLAHSQGLFPHP